VAVKSSLKNTPHYKAATYNLASVTKTCKTKVQHTANMEKELPLTTRDRSWLISQIVHVVSPLWTN